MTAPSTLPAPTTARNTRLWPVLSPPAATTWSTANVQYTELAMPTANAPASNGPERGQISQLGRRRGGSVTSPRWSGPGSTTSAHAVATAAISANSSHAVRQSEPTSSATGTAAHTPNPVPELMVASTRGRLASASRLGHHVRERGKDQPGAGARHQQAGEQHRRALGHARHGHPAARRTRRPRPPWPAARGGS